MRRNNKLIVIISIIAILAVVGVVIAYLYMATDVFKSNRELFAKYFTQDLETLQNNIDVEILDAYKTLDNESKYESNTKITMVHSEGGEISNPLNNLAVKLDIQRNDEEQYVYADGQILYEDEEYLETEIIKDKELYGIRFTDAVKQFVTIENDENIEVIADEIGLDIGQLEELINIIDRNEPTTEQEQSNSLKDKYLNIVTNAISSGTFEKQKNAMITYNNITTKTNAYSVLISSEQVENMLIEILNNIKTEEEILEKIPNIEVEEQIDGLINKINEELEIPTIKITVFEQKQKTIRTDVEIGLYKISIENIEQNEGTQTKINYSNLNSDEVIEYDFEINKKKTQEQEDYQIIINATEGEENYKISLLSQMRLSDNKIEFNTKISHEQDITTISLILENEVNIGTDFEKTQSLSTGNYIVLNYIEEQSRREELINLLKQIVPQKTIERIGLLKEKIGLNDEEKTEQVETESSTSQVEVNKFNAKFEFYTGDGVSAENVKTLLDVVKDNLNSYEIIANEPLENAESIGTEESKNNIKLYIEKDKTNEEGITKILEEIDDNKKYKVSIFYKESNGIIDYITITEN